MLKLNCIIRHFCFSYTEYYSKINRPNYYFIGIKRVVKFRINSKLFEKILNKVVNSKDQEKLCYIRKLGRYIKKSNVFFPEY